MNTYSEKYDIYGKKKGKIETENQYNFPDKKKYYGTICIVNREGDLTINQWNEYINLQNDNELLPESYDSED